MNNGMERNGREAGQTKGATDLMKDYWRTQLRAYWRVVRTREAGSKSKNSARGESFEHNCTGKIIFLELITNVSVDITGEQM